MKLKSERKVFHVVQYGDLERFIIEAYDVKEFELPCVEEIDNDTNVTFYVKPEPLDEYDQKELNKFKSGEYVSCVTHILLTDLCNKGWIEAGEYLINVSW